MDYRPEKTERSATFVVRVSRKSSEPWKGNISWVNERCQQSFDSMQELIELMDSSLTEKPSD